VVAFLAVVVFLEETLGVAVFLTVGFEAAFPAAFLGATALLGLSVTSLEVVLFGFSVEVLFTALTIVFLGFSPVEAGFLVVELVFLAEVGFLF